MNPLTIPPLLPEPPALPGLTFRSITGEQDAEALYAVHTGRVERDGVDLALHHEDLPTLDDLRTELAQAVANQEQGLWLVAEVASQVIGYTQLNGWHEEDGVWVYFIGGWVLPEWRNRGLGTCLLHWGEAMARSLASADHPDERFEFAANASSSEQEAAALLQHEGYTIAFTTLEMHFDPSTRLPDAPPLPQGLELRPMQPEHLPQIIASIIECYLQAFPAGRFRGTFDRVAYFSTKYQQPQFDPALWYIAWDGDQVAGQVILVIENGQVYVDQVSVRPAWRRKGLARALLLRALSDCQARGEQMIWLDTFAEYQTRAVDLYRALGFHVAKVFPRYRK